MTTQKPKNNLWKLLKYAKLKLGSGRLLCRPARKRVRPILQLPGPARGPHSHLFIVDSQCYHFTAGFCHVHSTLVSDNRLLLSLTCYIIKCSLHCQISPTLHSLNPVKDSRIGKADKTSSRSTCHLVHQATPLAHSTMMISQLFRSSQLHLDSQLLQHTSSFSLCSNQSNYIPKIT